MNGLVRGFALGSWVLGCTPTASVEPPTSIPTVAAKPVGPRYAVTEPGFSLYPDPARGLSHVQVQPDSRKAKAPRRVVELLETTPDGEWSRVRTLLPNEAIALQLESEAGVAVFNLTGWIPTYQVVEVEPGPNSMPATPELDDPGPEPADQTAQVQFEVPAGAVLRWPDGRVAGEVVEQHGFFSVGMLVSKPGDPPLICHDRRASPSVGVLRGWLCTTEGHVPEPGTTASNLLTLDEPATTPGESTGTMSRDVVREIVRSNIEQVRDCYNAALQIDPTLAGRVKVQFTISGNGSISSAIAIESLPAVPSVGVCIAEAVKTWRFPAVEGGGNIIVVYPFNLSPNKP